MEQRSSHTALVMSREEARKRLRERVDLAVDVYPSRIDSQDELAKAEQEEQRWRAYNRELLWRMFTTGEYAHDYDNAVVTIHHVRDQYLDVELNTIARRLQESIKQQAARIESIIDRLDLIDEAAADRTEATSEADLSKVFVVHGHDGAPKAEVARFIEKLGFEAIILHERPNKGRALITKFREEADGAGFAVVLMTPDDVGKAKDALDVKSRARQNVVFELGFFIGKIGPERVAALVKGKIELPSDFDGVVYISLDKEDWRTKLGAELKTAGYKIDWNKVHE